MKAKLFLILYLLFFIQSCDYSTRFDDNWQMPDKELESFLKHFYDNIMLGKIDENMAFLSNDSFTDQYYGSMADAHNFLQHEKYINHKMVHYESRVFVKPPNPMLYYLIYEYEFPDKWLYIHYQVSQKNDEYQVINMFIGLCSDMPINEMYRFDLINAKYIDCFMLLLTFLLWILQLFTTIYIIKSKIKYKWWWLISTQLSFCKIIFIWTEGLFRFNLLHVNLLAATITKQDYTHPWKISIGIPIITFIFWGLFFSKKIKNQVFENKPQEEKVALSDEEMKEE